MAAALAVVVVDVVVVDTGASSVVCGNWYCYRVPYDDSINNVHTTRCSCMRYEFVKV